MRALTVTFHTARGRTRGTPPGAHGNRHGDASHFFIGLLDNRYDGTLATQPPIPVGGSFTYRLTFPDAGIY